MGQQGIIVNFQAQLGFLLCSEILGDTRSFPSSLTAERQCLEIPYSLPRHSLMCTQDTTSVQ